MYCSSVISCSQLWRTKVFQFTVLYLNYLKIGLDHCCARPFNWKYQTIRPNAIFIAKFDLRRYLTKHCQKSNYLNPEIKLLRGDNSLFQDWTVVIILATGSVDSRFKPGRGQWIFFERKILSLTSFGREVKPWLPCRRFTARRRTSSRN